VIYFRVQMTMILSTGFSEEARNYDYELKIKIKKRVNIV